MDGESFYGELSSLRFLATLALGVFIVTFYYLQMVNILLIIPFEKERIARSTVALLSHHRGAQVGYA